MDNASGKVIAFPAHDKPIRSICFTDKPADIATTTTTPQSSPSKKDPTPQTQTHTAAPVLATASWDHTVRLWDLRNTHLPLHTFDLGERVYAMDCVGGLLAAVTADRVVHQIETGGKMRRRECPPPLEHQIRTIAVGPDGKRWIVGSIGGMLGYKYVPEPMVKR
jgi:WD40 repeat protein